MTARLSIIIPTYNRARMIGDMIRSIYRQHYHNVEIVVIDDGSIDNTRKVVVDLQNSEQRLASMDLKYFHQENAGAPAARNEGIRQASSEFFMFADSDDELTTDGIMAGMNALTTKKVDYVYMRVVEVNTRDGPEARKLKGSRYDGGDRELIGHHWHTMASIYSRRTIERVGYWLEGVPCSEDWEYQIRVKLSRGSSIFLDEQMGYWKIHSSDRLSTNKYCSRYVRGVFDVCKSIQSHCQRADRFEGVTRKRLVNRLVRHALEAGVHGDLKLRREILEHCCGLVEKPLETLVIKGLLSFRSQRLDLVAYRTLCAIR